MRPHMLLLGLLLAPAALSAQSVTLIRDARVFDGERVLAASDVLIRDGRIAAVGRALVAPAGAVVVEAAGHTLMPGLIDAHTHVFGDALREALAAGVTTELDMFTDVRQAQALRAQQDAGRAGGRADIYTAGTLVTAPRGHGTEYGMAIPTLTAPDSAQAFVDARIAEGSDWIKIVYDDGAHFGLDWPTLDRATLTAAIAAAHRRARLALVHVSTAAQARDAITAGADGLVHLFTDAPASDELIALAQARGVFVIPTLVVLKSITGEPGAGALLHDERFAPYLTPVQRSTLGLAFPAVPSRASGYAHALAAVRRLHAAGVPILAGTDAPNPGTAHGVAMHRELELLVEAGLSPTAALAAATGVPARRFGLTDRGRIAEGMRADLLLVHGDATVDITATRSIAGIWKGGERFDRAAYAAELAAPAGATAGAVDGPVLLADFEDGSLRARVGTEWLTTTDSMMGGGSFARLEVVAGGAGDARSLQISGTITDAVPYAWAGAMWGGGMFPMQPADLSAARGVAFRTRGDGGTYRVLLFAQARGMTPLIREFTASADWTDVEVPWSTFGIDGSDIMAVMIVGGPAPGPFRVQVDHVRLY